VIYLAWWILLTPTQEAWLRRIMNGLIVAEVIAIVAIYRLAGSRNPAAIIAMIALGAASLYTIAHNQLLWDRPDDRVENAANRAFFDRVAALPNDARLYAAAWYQSPVTALIAGRRFYDFTRPSAAEINGSSAQRFLVIEQVALYQRGWLAEVLERCACEPVFANAGGRIYRINDVQENANPATKRTTFVTAVSDGFGAGFYVGDADVRWTSERAQFRLPVSAFDHLVLWLHVPRPEQMTSGPGPSILEIRWGECLLAREQLSAGENHLLIRSPCQDRKLGDTLEFRMNGHLTSAAAGRDTRNLSWMFRTMEFMSDSEPTSTSRAGEVAKP